MIKFNEENLLKILINISEYSKSLSYLKYNENDLFGDTLLEEKGKFFKCIGIIEDKIKDKNGIRNTNKELIYNIAISKIMDEVDFIKIKQFVIQELIKSLKNEIENLMLFVDYFERYFEDDNLDLDSDEDE